MKKYIHFQVILLALILFIPGFMMAGDRYVSTTGSNITGNGTAANPWRTVQFAVNNSVTGDVIHIAAGTYVESNIVVNKPLIITGVPASRDAVVMAPAAEDGNADNAFADNAQNGFVIAASDVTISNLTLNGKANPALTAGKSNYRAGIVTLDASQSGGGVWSGLHLDNLLIMNIYRRGISVFPRSVSGTLIENCGLEAVSYNHGIYLAGQGVVRNNNIGQCFQGIVVNPDASTPAGLIMVTGNILTDIGNFPGCWGDLGGGVYTGQPRGIEFDNASGAPLRIEISGNSITGLEEGSGAVGIYTRRASDNSVVANNTISFNTGYGSVGILAGWSYANGFMIRNNNIHVSSTSSAIYVFGSGSAIKPVILEGNTLTGSSSVYTGPGEGTGVVMTNRYLDGADEYESYVVVRNNNTITGFARGIDVVNLVASTPQPALTLQVINNTTFISGNNYGIYANFGSLTITGSKILSNLHTGIHLAGTATAVINNNEIGGNVNWGLNNITGVVVDALNNWWGDCSGPFHPVQNPNGAGNKVSNNVNFIPWYIGVEAFAMTGGGSYCQGGPGIAVGISGSQANVYYQLYRDNIPTGGYAQGTGSALSFGLQTIAGVYTVRGFNTIYDCSLEMTGTAVISVILLPGAAGTISGAAIVQQGQTGVTYTVSPIANATAYSWSLPPGATITSGGNNTIDVSFSATAASGYMRVSGSNVCGTGTISPRLFVNVIPTVNNVTNIVVSDGEIRCFDAVQVINVAGNGSYFMVQDGGQATFIAGQKVFLLPGTVVEQGGSMRAYITTNGYYCAGLLPPAKNGGDEEPEGNTATQSLTGLFKVYPNPTAGRFTLELHPDVEPGPMTMVIFGMRGEIVMKQEIAEPALKSEFTLAERQPGIYIIRVMKGDRVETAKIIRLQ